MARFLPGKEYPKIGRIVGAFGLKGQVKVEALTDFVQRFEEGAVFRINGARALTLDGFQLEATRGHGIQAPER